jgi:hypothetical protein
MRRKGEDHGRNGWPVSDLHRVDRDYREGHAYGEKLREERLQEEREQEQAEARRVEHRAEERRREEDAHYRQEAEEQERQLAEDHERQLEAEDRETARRGVVAS